MSKIKRSKTAHLIAESLYFSASNLKLKTLISADSVEFSGLFPVKRNRFLRFVRNNLLNRAIPGITLHYLLRKKRIEAFVRQAISGDFRQIIILGAGFDTLSLRLGAEFENVRFIEIDRFESQLQKVRTLNRRQIPFPNLSFFTGDFEAQTLREILNSSLFEPQIKTFFIAEGLLMYLSETKVKQLFSTVAEICEAETRLAFTFMDKRGDGKIRFQNSSGFVDFWLDLQGEPFKWGISRADLPDFLVEVGFEPNALETDEDFRRFYLADANLQNEMLARGEFLCLATARRKQNA